MKGETYVRRPNDPRADEFGMVPKHLAGPLNESERAPMVMGDIEPYRAVAADTDGKRHVIGGRRQHREFLQRNGYQEIGNDYVPPRREQLSTGDRVADIKRAMRD
jgi:hypothetical protein